MQFLVLIKCVDAFNIRVSSEATSDAETVATSKTSVRAPAPWYTILAMDGIQKFNTPLVLCVCALVTAKACRVFLTLYFSYCVSHLSEH